MVKATAVDIDETRTLQERWIDECFEIINDAAAEPTRAARESHKYNKPLESSPPPQHQEPPAPRVTEDPAPSGEEPSTAEQHATECRLGTLPAPLLAD
jgi:hypothetical protein